MKSPRQQFIDAIMQDNEDDEDQLEYLQSLTLKELQALAENVQTSED